MATSTITLYYTYSTISGSKWELIPSKLLVVEDIASYLATKTSKTISNFQYIKNELEIQINVEISQDYSQPRSATNFKYVSIQNTDEAIHYYFVKKATWRSKTCVRFELVLDVLNTFQEGRDYNFKANTRIVREHKDRFLKRVQDRFLEFTLFTYIETGTISPNDDIIVYDRNNANVLEGTLVSLTLDPEFHSGKVNIKISSNETRTDEEIRSALYLLRLSTITFKKDNSNYLAGTLTALGQVQHTYEYFRNIDIVNEGISPVLQNQTAVGNKIESSSSAIKKDWYLLYRNQEDYTETGVNPVECYLIPKTETQTDVAYIESGRLIPSWLEDGKYYFFYVDNGETYTLSNGTTITYSGAGKQILLIYKTENKICVQYHALLAPELPNNWNIWTYDDIEYITITGLPVAYNVSTSGAMTHSSLYGMSFPYTFNNSGTYSSVDGIDELDKSDPKNIKLIKLPYVPYDFDIVSSVLQIDNDDYWEFVSFSQQSGGDMYALKLKDMNLKLSSTLSLTSSLYHPLKTLYFGSISPSLTDARKGQSYESKLYNSDFYQPTYVYDSFTYKVQLEKLNINLYTPTSVESFTIKFHMSSTINSRFMFEFSDLKFAYATENYAKYMPIARNNEEVLYNVPYINYIRTGFNYDVKSKERTNISNAIGMGLSVASTASALLLPSVPLKVAGVVAGLVSIAMSVKNTIVSAQQNEDSIRRKLQETANQTASVAGSDDVDLMSVYAENRLKYLVYEPTPLMKSILFDLFFYAGYASGRMGIPTHNNRVNFDYLECEANLENEGSIPDDCLQELINCFKTGITYLHKTTRTSDKWDFEQKYENWEKDLMED